MQPDGDVAFLRHAVEASLLSPSQAELCLGRVQSEAKAGRPACAAAVAVELGLLDEAVVRGVIAEVARLGPASSPPSTRGWGASVVAGAPGAPAAPAPSAPPPDLSWGAVRSTGRHARKVTSERVAAAPDPPSARLPAPPPAPPERPDPSGQTAELQAVLPLPAPPSGDGSSERTMKLLAVLPLPPGPPSDADLIARTMKVQAVLPLPGQRASEDVPPAGPAPPADAPLAAAIAEATARAERSAVAPPAPALAPPAPTRALVTPAPHEGARSRANSYFVAAGVALAVLVGVGARSASPPVTAPPPMSGPATTEAPPPDPGAPRAFAPRLTAAPAPPPVAHPDEVLAAFEAAVDRHIEGGHFATALALEAGLPPDVGADPGRRERLLAARRRIEEAHGAAASQQRRALAELVDQGQLVRAREAARAAAAWAIGPVDFSREVEVLASRRDAELADFSPAPGLDLPRLEAGLRSLLAGFGEGSSLWPNGAISLDYGAASAALAEDLAVRAPRHELGVRIDAGARPVLAVHRLPLAQVLDVTLEFVVLTRPRETACLALLLVDPARREPLGHGLTWDCELVRLARGQGLVRSTTAAGRPATPRVPYRLTLTVPRGGPPALGGAVVEQREGGWRLAAAPAPVAPGIGQVAVYVRDVDVCLTGLQVRGVVDPARVPTTR